MRTFGKIERNNFTFVLDFVLFIRKNFTILPFLIVIGMILFSKNPCGDLNEFGYLNFSMLIIPVIGKGKRKVQIDLKN
jgi:hypothetical protein